MITAPPPSSGGVALLQMLQMKADAAPLFAGVALNSPQYMHLLAEIEKRVFADRAAYLGDPDFVKVPVARLLAPELSGAPRRRDRSDAGRRATARRSRRAGEAPDHPLFHHRQWGNAVSNTYTLNGDFGAGVVVEGAGFLLNDEMDDFSAKPGAPNQYGVVGGEANAIAPGKRPLSSMTPTILVRDGRVGHGHRHAGRLAHLHLGVPGVGRRL